MACGSATQKVESYCERIARSRDMTMTATVQADFGETTEEYTLKYTFDGTQWIALVTEPQFVAGITARITKDASELEYEGVILSTGDLTGGGIVPISAVPLIYETITVGMADSVWEEGELLGGSFVYDDTIGVNVWFDREGDPVAAELIEQGVVKAKCILNDVEIKEATDGTTEKTDLGGNQPEESGT